MLKVLGCGMGCDAQLLTALSWSNSTYHTFESSKLYHDSLHMYEL